MVGDHVYRVGAVWFAGVLAHPAEGIYSIAQLLDQPADAGISAGGSQQPITPTDVLTELQLVTSAPVKKRVARNWAVYRPSARPRWAKPTSSR